MIEDVDLAVAGGAHGARRQVRSVDGKDVAVQADTLCIHGDQPNALVFASGIRQALEDAGIEVARAARLSYRDRNLPRAGPAGSGAARPGQARRSRGACSSASCSEARR